MYLELKAISLEVFFFFSQLSNSYLKLPLSRTVFCFPWQFKLEGFYSTLGIRVFIRHQRSKNTTNIIQIHGILLLNFAHSLKELHSFIDNNSPVTLHYSNASTYTCTYINENPAAYPNPNTESSYFKLSSPQIPLNKQ